MTIDTGNASYDPNSVDAAFPKEVPPADGGFATYPERIDGVKRRVRSESFKDHFSQATLFWNSMSPVEKDHIVGAFSFELAKLERPEIRVRVLEKILANIDATLASRVAANVGLPAPAAPTGSARKKSALSASPALSMANTVKGSVKTRKVAILAADGVDGAAIDALKGALAKAGATGLVLAAHLGTLKGAGQTSIAVDHTFATMPSVTFDGVYIPGGSAGVAALAASGEAVGFVAESYRHCKAIGAQDDARLLLERAGLRLGTTAPEGVVLGSGPAGNKAFIHALAGC